MLRSAANQLLPCHPDELRRVRFPALAAAPGGQVKLDVVLERSQRLFIRPPDRIGPPELRAKPIVPAQIPLNNQFKRPVFHPVLSYPNMRNSTLRFLRGLRGLSSSKNQNGGLPPPGDAIVRHGDLLMHGILDEALKRLLNALAHLRVVLDDAPVSANEGLGPDQAGQESSSASRPAICPRFAWPLPWPVLRAAALRSLRARFGKTKSSRLPSRWFVVSWQHCIEWDTEEHELFMLYPCSSVFFSFADNWVYRHNARTQRREGAKPPPVLLCVFAPWRPCVKHFHS